MAPFLVEFFPGNRLIAAPMFRFVAKLLLVLAVAALAAAGARVWLSPDPTYTLESSLHGSRYWDYDELIRDAGSKYGVDPMLIKSVVWRESKFQPDKVGTSGERGLMQVGEAAAADWAKAEKVETFMPTDLFDPKTNLDAGVWYLSRAVERWKAKADPVPFALAEYNAGRSRVDRWIAQTARAEDANAADLLAVIDFPITRKYVETITARHRFYRARGRM